MLPKVYLAGPITGQDYAGATDWRNKVKAELNAVGIQVFSPMRGKEYLSHVKEFTANGDEYKPFSVMSSNRGITTRDRYDCTHADLVIVNMLGADRVSIGTTMEVAWADANRTPIVLIMEPEGNVHHHGMLLECAGFWCHTLEDAMKIAKVILLEGGDPHLPTGPVP